MEQDRKYLYWGLTAFCVICGVLVFYDTVFQNSVLFDYIGKLITILSPVSYGFVMAYVLSPVVNAVERLLSARRRMKIPSHGRRAPSASRPVTVCSPLTASLLAFT